MQDKLETARRLLEEKLEEVLRQSAYKVIECDMNNVSTASGRSE